MSRPNFYLWIAASVIAMSLCTAESHAFGIFSADGLDGGRRWDAGPRSFEGFERSLDGGLRYSVQGGSYEAYRDEFSWRLSVPSVADFRGAVEAAFAAWTTVDPVSGLGTDLSFTPDLGTAVDPGKLNNAVRLGSEIDLLATDDGAFWDPGDQRLRAQAFISSGGFGDDVTLTTGASNYAGLAISGADISFNNDPGALWDLVSFQTILTHEIGHALGLADVDIRSGPEGTYIDDNYDGSTSATALATLTNSFAHLIDPYDPANSPLSVYTVADGDPGLDTLGVDILMESEIPGSLYGLSVPLRNDDYAGRQFLYPYVIPEPATAMLLIVGGCWAFGRRAQTRIRQRSHL